MKRSISNKTLYYILGIAMLVISWQAFSLLIGERRMLFPGPFETIRHTAGLLESPYTWRCIFETMKRMLAGFSISFLLALLLGVIAGNSESFTQVFKPLIIFLRSVPTASLVYIFIALSGFRNAPILLVIMLSFPIMYEGISAGIRNVDENIIKASRIDGAAYLKENLRIRLPLALPYIIVSMASSFSLSFKVEIMAEVITGSTMPGIGSAIYGVRAADPTNMVPVFAYSLIAVVLMLMIDLLCQRVNNRKDI